MSRDFRLNTFRVKKRRVQIGDTVYDSITEAVRKNKTSVTRLKQEIRETGTFKGEKAAFLPWYIGKGNG